MGQAPEPPSRSSLTGAELPQTKKSFVSMHAGSLQLCRTLCDPVDCGLPGFSVGGVLQARILECIGQCWLPSPSRALHVLLPSLTTPLSNWCCQSSCDPSSCTTFMLNSHWGRAATGKEKSCVYVSRVTLVISTSLQPCREWPARLLCQEGRVLQARILECIGQYWLPCPSRALYFLLP